MKFYFIRKTREVERERERYRQLLESDIYRIIAT